MRKNDFDLPISLSIAKLTVEINFQTIKKKKSENQTNKIRKTKCKLLTKGRKNIGESTVNRITKINSTATKCKHTSNYINMNKFTSL